MKIVTKQNCPECESIKSLMDAEGVQYEEFKMEELTTPEQFKLRTIAKKNRQMAMPLLFCGETFISNEEFKMRGVSVCK